MIRYCTPLFCVVALTTGMIPGASSAQAQKARAASLTVTNLHLEQYVSVPVTGRVLLKNVTTDESILVTNIASLDSDFLNGFISYTSAALPIVLNAGDTAGIEVTFLPNANQGNSDRSSGRRSYTADLEFENTAGMPVTSHVTGQGIMVAMHAFIDRNYIAAPRTTVEVAINVDRWNDSLHATHPTDMRGFIFELTHYKRTLVHPDSGYNESGAGFVGTISAGSICIENSWETNLEDSAHNIGTQGYYELNVLRGTINMGRTGTLMRIRLNCFGGAHVDTSELTFAIRMALDPQMNQLPYVNITTSPGLITVDSILSLSVYPNPVWASHGTIRFSSPLSTAAMVVVRDALGRIVGCDRRSVVAGMNIIPMDLSSLAPGLYACEVQMGSVVHRATVVKTAP
jgi:hypothetical protein